MLSARFLSAVFILSIVSPVHAADGLTTAKKYLKVKQFGPAVQLASAFIKTHPRSVDAYMLRAEAYVSTNQFSKAMADLEAVLKIDPSSAEAYYKRAWIHDEFCHHRQMVEDLKKAQSLSPEAGYMLENLAWAYDELGEYEKEFETWTRLTRLGPGYAYNGHAGRALAHIRLCRFREAALDCTKALSLSRTDAWMHHLRGYSYHHLKEYRKALTDYSECVKINPQSMQNLNNRALCWYEMGQYQKAIDDYTRALSFNELAHIVYANRALAYWKLGDRTRAKSDYAQLLSVDERQSARARVVLSVSTLFAEYKPLPILSMGRLHDPVYSSPVRTRLPGEERRSVADYDTIIKLSPNELDSYYHRGVAKLCLGQSAEAAADFSVYLDKCSWTGSGPIYAACLLYVALSQDGRKEAAHKALLRALPHLKQEVWPAPVVNYLLRKCTARGLLRSKGLKDQTVARYFIGVDLIHNGFIEDGLSELKWVSRHGDPDIEEHLLSLSEIDRQTKREATR